MTDGHKHRHIKVHEGSVVDRFFRNTTIFRTRDTSRAVHSKFVYGHDSAGYRLSLLGFLHGLFGLTLEIEENDRM